ncbi:hypothetical protein Tco_0636853 [Tanacetum coccineum]
MLGSNVNPQEFFLLRNYCHLRNEAVTDHPPILLPLPQAHAIARRRQNRRSRKWPSDHNHKIYNLEAESDSLRTQMLKLQSKQMEITTRFLWLALGLLI